MRVLVLALIPATFAFVRPAGAADSAHDARAGVEAGVRLGAGVGLGSTLYDGRTGTEPKLGGLVTPLQLDVGYRITRFIYAGTYFQRASSSNAVATSAGGLLRMHLTPARVVDPWLGMGIGYEWYRDDSIALRGFQWGQLAAGADVRVSGAFVTGPFVSAAFGQYTSYSTATESGKVRDVGREVGHTFLTFGVRGAFML